jgi:predicted GIY-YIG superfamily endonuclease
MSLELPADVEPFGTEWHQSGVYVLRYAVPDDVHERAERVFDHPPQWLDALSEAEKVLYCGMSGNVMGRLEDHRDGGPRKTVLTKLDCEPVGVVNVIYHDSAEEADRAEWNTAKRVARQTDDQTLTICNGEPV